MEKHQKQNCWLHFGRKFQETLQKALSFASISFIYQEEVFYFDLFLSDGVTACGIFIAIGILIEKIKLEQEVDVAFVVRALRQVRASFVSDMVRWRY